VGAEVIRKRTFFDYVGTMQGFEPPRAIGLNQIQFPRRWRQHVPPKRLKKFIILHDIRICSPIILERSAVGLYVRYGTGRI